MNKTLSGCIRELGKVQLGNPKSGHGQLQEQSLMRTQNHNSNGVAYESGCKESFDCI